MKPDLEFKLDLSTLHPESVSASELADLLRDLEKAIQAEADIEDDTATTRADSEIEVPAISLVGVRAGSSVYDFAIGGHVKNPVARLMKGLAVGGREWASISPMAQEVTSRAVSRFLKQNIPVTIRSALPGVPDISFSVDHPPPVVNRTMFAESQATRSIDVLKAGGVRPAASVLLTGEGYRVPVTGPKRLIQQLGGQLYQRAIISGLAQWRLKDLRLVLFKVQKVEPYPSEDVSQVLAQVSKLSGNKLALAGGIPGFFAEFRDEDEGEDEE